MNGSKYLIKKHSETELQVTISTRIPLNFERISIQDQDNSETHAVLRVLDE